jgi:hypothetical protein
MFKILGAKNRQKNLHKHPGPPFQIRGGPGSFSNAKKDCKTCHAYVDDEFQSDLDYWWRFSQSLKLPK